MTRALSFGGHIDLNWAAHVEVAHYRLRLAADAGCKNVLRDIQDLRSLVTILERLSPGVWHWQLASLRADGDQGPWGNACSFWCSVRHHAAHKTATLTPRRRCKSWRYFGVSLWFAPGPDGKCSGFLECLTASNTALESRQRRAKTFEVEHGLVDVVVPRIGHQQPLRMRRCVQQAPAVVGSDDAV